MKDKILYEKKVNSKNIFKGKILDVYLDEVKCFNGNLSKREYIKHPGGVCILAIDLEDNVFIEKQYRYSLNKIIYELPAGKLELGENPITAAYREFEEETGYQAIDLVNLGYMYPSCGYTNEIIHLFYTDKFVKTHKNLDEDEQIEIVKMPLNEIKDKILKNEITDAKTICLILKYIMYKKI